MALSGRGRAAYTAPRSSSQRVRGSDYLGTDLTIWSAPSPKGPFDGGRTIARIPSNSETGQLRYMPLAHPDLSSDPSTIVISYSRNNTDTEKVVDNPFLYRPQFLEAPLPTGRQQ